MGVAVFPAVVHIKDVLILYLCTVFLTGETVINGCAPFGCAGVLFVTWQHGRGNLANLNASSILYEAAGTTLNPCQLIIKQQQVVEML